MPRPAPTTAPTIGTSCRSMRVTHSEWARAPADSSEELRRCSFCQRYPPLRGRGGAGGIVDDGAANAKLTDEELAQLGADRHAAYTGRRDACRQRGGHHTGVDGRHSGAAGQFPAGRHLGRPVSGRQTVVYHHGAELPTVQGEPAAGSDCDAQAVPGHLPDARVSDPAQRILSGLVRRGHEGSGQAHRDLPEYAQGTSYACVNVQPGGGVPFPIPKTPRRWAGTRCWVTTTAPQWTPWVTAH